MPGHELFDTVTLERFNDVLLTKAPRPDVLLDVAEQGKDIAQRLELATARGLVSTPVFRDRPLFHRVVTLEPDQTAYRNQGLGDQNRSGRKALHKNVSGRHTRSSLLVSPPTPWRNRRARGYDMAKYVGSWWIRDTIDGRRLEAEGFASTLGGLYEFDWTQNHGENDVKESDFRVIAGTTQRSDHGGDLRVACAAGRCRADVRRAGLMVEGEISGVEVGRDEAVSVRFGQYLPLAHPKALAEAGYGGGWLEPGVVVRGRVRGK